jgi:hypothetical protein
MNLRSFTRRLDHLAERIDNHVRRSVFAYRARRVYESRSHPIRLHVGCGSVHLEGWINTDFYESRTTDLPGTLPCPIPYRILSAGSSITSIFWSTCHSNASLRTATAYWSPVEYCASRCLPSKAVVQKYIAPDWCDQAIKNR